MMSHGFLACILPDVRRRGPVTIALGAVFALVSAPALASGERTIIATDDPAFFPANLTVPPDTTINWDNHGLFHNVKFDDGSFEEPADPQATPWRVTRHFDEPGVYRFYCEMHGGPGGQGMSGTIIVEAGANPTLTRLRVQPKRRRAVIRFKLSKDARVAGGIDPLGNPAGRPSRDLSFAGKEGANRRRVKVGGLAPGRYRLTLAAEDENGNESDPATAKFRIKRPRR
jgi:plastocyanin